jgi:hypothetical protein
MWCAPPFRTVGFQNCAASSHVWEKGDKVFGESFRATTGFITDADDAFRNDDFFPDVDDLFDDMADITNNGHAAASASAHVLISPIFRFMFQILVQFLVLAFGVDMLSSNSLLRMIFAYFLKVHMTSLIHVIVVMFYLLFLWIKFCGKLFIFPTLQKTYYRQFTPSSFAASMKRPVFEGANYKRWRVRAVL